MASYVLAMDTDMNVAHAYEAGAATTACDLPTKGLELGDGTDFDNRSFSVCGECRKAWQG